MSAVDTPLTDVVSGLLPDDLPELVSPEWVAQTFGLHKTAVFYAIRNGKLPVLTVTGGGNSKRTATYAIKPADALRIWGYRLVTAALEAESAVHTAAKSA